MGLVEIDEELAHLGLPKGVDLGGGHALSRGGQVGGLEVADQQAVLAQEQ